jgi:WD40 repeat protein
MEIINETFEDSSANTISFNQDYSLISIGTNRGYKIIQISPVFFHENNLSGSLSRCELSYRSNLLALVGGGKIPKFNSKKVVIYNDLEDCIESEYKFATPVLNVKFKKDFIFIVCEKKIYVFNLNTSQNIDTFDTIMNKQGIIAVNGCPEKTIMAHPIEPEDEPDKGYVGIKNYKTNKYFPLLVHDEKISYMEMDYNGLILATANDKGTIIRLHNLLDKTLIYECKRGKDKATINFITFDMEYNYIGVTSSKGTIHIWKLDDFIQKEKKDNKMIYSLKKNNNNGYKTELSFAKIKFQKQCIFCFRTGNNVFIVSKDEKYFNSKIDKKGGYFNATEIKDFYKNKNNK